ncbi:MAG: DUF1326 domain-containing protein [Pseudomonadota bacterium]
MSDNWKLEGNYFESCNCDLVCPCIFLDPPTEGFCEAQVGWEINKGHLDDVNLDGVKIGVWLHAPGPLTEGGWDLALYVDDKASKEQFDAVCQLWSGEHGGHLAIISSLVGNVMSAEQVPIEISTSNPRSLKIGDVGELVMPEIEGADGKTVTVSNMPLAVAPGYDITVCRSEKNTYTGNGKNWSQVGKVGLASPFTYGP